MPERQSALHAILTTQATQAYEPCTQPLTPTSTPPGLAGLVTPAGIPHQPLFCALPHSRRTIHPSPWAKQALAPKQQAVPRSHPVAPAAPACILALAATLGCKGPQQHEQKCYKPRGTHTCSRCFWINVAPCTAAEWRRRGALPRHPQQQISKVPGATRTCCRIASATTCAFVRIVPSGSTMKPLPLLPVERPGMPLE
jgi:hypothetical protein